MDIEIDFKTPALYDDPAYDTDNLDSSGTSSSGTSSTDDPTSNSSPRQPKPKVRRITPSTYPDAHLKKPEPKLTIRIPRKMIEPTIHRLVPSSFPESHLKKREQKVTIRIPENYPDTTTPATPQPEPAPQPLPESRKSDTTTPSTSDPQSTPQPEPAPLPLPESQKSDKFLFTVLTINTWLISTWTVLPADKYLNHLNIAVLRDAPSFIWNLPAGLRLRDSIKDARREFMKSLYTCTNSSQTKTAAELFLRKIDDWITALETYARRFPSITTRQRKAAAMMVRHRARNLTYRAVLRKFGAEPTMENLVAVRGALKELYILKNIC